MSDKKSYKKYDSDEARHEALKKQKKESYQRNLQRNKIIMKKKQINDMIVKIKNGLYIKPPKYSLEELNCRLNIVCDMLENKKYDPVF